MFSIFLKKIFSSETNRTQVKIFNDRPSLENKSNFYFLKSIQQSEIVWYQEYNLIRKWGRAPNEYNLAYNMNKLPVFFGGAKCIIVLEAYFTIQPGTKVFPLYSISSFFGDGNDGTKLWPS